MANYSSHLQKARENLSLLEHLECSRPNDLDWKITVCFYSSLHLINAYLAKEKDWHFRTHKKVQDALNPFIGESTALDNDTFNSYEQLYKLSRRSRYLCDPDAASDSDTCYLVNNRHHKKALLHLHTIMVFFSNKYGEEFDPISINNTFFKNDSTCPLYNYLEIEEEEQK